MTSVFDMSGNVWEWLAETIRGGGFKSGAGELGCGTPGVQPFDQYTSEIGFRCCKAL